MHAGDPLGEVAGQDSLAGTDFEDDVFRRELGQPTDHAEDVRIAQEVLAVLPFHSPKHRAAFRSICRPSSPGSSPRARAEASTVWTTFAGSLGLPPAGCGAPQGGA